MGRHPCDVCGDEGWDYTDTYCANSGNGPCDYWDGRDVCEECMVYVECGLCDREGCDHCIEMHCDDCQVYVCTSKAIGGGNKKSKKEEGEEEKELPCMDSVIEDAKYECGHTGCSTLPNKSFCPKCFRKNQAEQHLVDQKHDLELMRTMRGQLKTCEAREFVGFYIHGKKIVRKGYKIQIQ